MKAALFSRKDRITGTADGCYEKIEAVDNGRSIRNRRKSLSTSPCSAVEIPLSIILSPINEAKPISSQCNSTPSVMETSFAPSLPLSMAISPFETDVTHVIRSSFWFKHGRGRSYHDDDFFTKMARVTQAIMPSLLSSNSNLSLLLNTYSPGSSLSSATRNLSLGDNDHPYGSKSHDGNSHDDKFRRKYSREFELFICNILKKTGLSAIVLLLALKYIHRLRLAYPEVSPTSGSEYRLFSVAMILANKYLEDRTFTNKTWASLTAMPITEVNIMEREFLTILDFDLCINEIDFSNWISAVEGLLKSFGTFPSFFLDQTK